MHIVNTKYGPVSGIRRNGCEQYLGIPYARPPVGERMFRHPEEPEPWTEVRMADRGSANPVQAEAGFKVWNNSLDCLYLNIFVPEEKKETPRPVMVWLYGGNYAQGGVGAVRPGSEALVYDLARFAAETDTVVVALNYRLNLYGFLNLHFLDPSFDSNNGLYDQIRALEFVRDNIAAFGGDPRNVTLFGQSAGGACTLALMTMPEAKGLFHKTIVQSACIEHFFTEKESRRYTRRYLRFAGVKEPEELKDLSMQRVERANKLFSNQMRAMGEIRCAFSPVIDGRTLRREPKQAVRECDLPMLIGNTSQEANLFLGSTPAAVLPFVERAIHVRAVPGKGDYKQRVCDGLTDHIYIRPQLEILRGYRGPAWRYEYHHVLPHSSLGCFHASEVAVLFCMNGMFGPVDDPETQRVGAAMRKIWRDFAWNGDPGWEPFPENEMCQRIP